VSLHLFDWFCSGKQCFLVQWQAQHHEIRVLYDSQVVIQLYVSLLAMGFQIKFVCARSLEIPIVNLKSNNCCHGHIFTCCCHLFCNIYHSKERDNSANSVIYTSFIYISQLRKPRTVTRKLRTYEFYCLLRLPRPPPEV